MSGLTLATLYPIVTPAAQWTREEEHCGKTHKATRGTGHAGVGPEKHPIALFFFFLMREKAMFLES